MIVIYISPYKVCWNTCLIHAQLFVSCFSLFFVGLCSLCFEYLVCLYIIISNMIDAFFFSLR